VSIGRGSITEFQHSLQRYTKCDHFFLSKNADNNSIKNLMLQLKKYNLVIAAVNNLGNFVSSNYRITDTQQKVIQQVTTNGKCVIVLFGNPYILNYLEGLEKAYGLVVAYQENTEAQDLAGQLLFGAFGAKGKLPVTVNENYHSGDGIATPAIDRFKYTLPEELGIDSTFLKKKN
jgi:hypothetical protein